MTWPNFSFDVNLGQLIVAGSVSLLGWAVRRTYKFGVHAVERITKFVDRVNENDDLLDATTSVVDDHSQTLIKHGILDGPVVRLNRRKRSGDPAVFTKNGLS